MSFEEWERTVPEMLKADTLWKMKVYRSALFLNGLAQYAILLGVLKTSYGAFDLIGKVS